MLDEYLKKKIVFGEVALPSLKDGGRKPSTLPTTPGFVGRVGELRRLREEFEWRHIFIIEGMAGCGKTYLAAHFACEMRNRYRIFFGECQEGLGLSTFLAEINDFLLAEGEMGFDLILQDASLSMTHKIRGLVNVLERERYILILDDLYHLKEEELIEPITLFDRFLEKTRLILLSRKTPHFLRDLKPNNVFEIVLGGFTEDEATSYLQDLTDLKDEAILREVSKKTGGLPLALNLFGSLCRYYKIEELMVALPDYAREVINQNLIDRVFAILNEEEIRMLTSFSVFRRPVSPKVLSYLYPGTDWEKIFVGLIDKLQLNRTDNGRILMHPLIRQFAYERCKEKRKSHIIAARFYSLEGGLDNALEAYYHYLEAGEFNRADEIVVRIGDELIRCGNVDLAHKMVSHSLKGAYENPEFHLLLGKILQRWGRFDEAIAEYDWACSHFTDLGKKALAQNQIGGVYLYKGDTRSAQTFLEESLNLRKRISDEGGVAEGLHQMGVLNLSEGDYHRAMEYLKESLRITRSLNDKGAASQTLNEMGRAHFYEKEYEMSLLRLKEALSLSRESKDRCTEATILHNMGSVYLETGDYERSGGLFEESLRIREEIGDRLGMGRSLHQIGNLYLEKGDDSKALGYFEKSRLIFEELGSDDTKYPKQYLDIIKGCKTANGG